MKKWEKKNLRGQDSKRLLLFKKVREKSEISEKNSEKRIKAA